MRNPNTGDCVLLIIEILEDPESSHDLHHHSADNASHGDESSCMEDYGTRITKLLVNPIVLAEKSPFFHDLIKNATMESEQQRCVTLSIQASEETAVMDLLNYMHSGTTLTEETALLDLLKLADKFEVVSCMRLCASLLTKMPVTLESALVYLSLVMADEEVQHLVDAAKQFVATRFVDFKDNRDEIMTLPLAVMEVILSSDSIEPVSEDTVFELALDWVKARYPNNPEDQRKIFSTRLAPHIRFPYMSPWMLKEWVLTCDLLDDARKATVDALYFQITNPIHHHHYTTAATDNSTGRVRRRPYCDSLVKVVEFEFPCPEIVVYHDLCMLTDDDPTLCTEDFRWGPHWFNLYVVSASHAPFTIYLEKHDDAYEPVQLHLEYEFAVRSERTKRFVLKSGGPLEFDASSTIYETPLLDFKAGKSLDFIDGVIYIELKLRKKNKW